MTDLEKKGRVSEILVEIGKSLSDDALKAKLDEAKKLVNEVGVVPSHFAIDEREVIEEFDGGSYCICKTSWYMHFYTKGGYHIFASPKYVSLYGTLESMLKNLKDGKNDPETEAMLMAVTYLIECPMFCFGSADVTMKLANCVIDCLTDMYQKSLEETPADAESDGTFREISEAMEEIAPVVEEMDKRVSKVVKDEGEDKGKESEPEK